jgi:hypothetical protein
MPIPSSIFLTFKTLKFHSHQSGTKGLDAEVGGLTIGGGLGYAF